MIYTDDQGERRETPFHGQRSNLDWAKLVAKRDQRAGVPQPDTPKRASA